jgi:hypothetical protein
MSTDLQSDLPTLEALDGEFGPDEISSGTSSERRRRLAWLASLVALGLVGAAILAPTLWYVEWPSIAWLFVIPSKEAIGGHVPANLNDQIADLVHERDALQKTINELAAAQERAVDAIVSLEAAGAASQERAPSNQGPSYWYSVPSTLSYRSINFPRAVSSAPRSSTSAQSDVRDSRTANANANAPLPLASPEQ